MPTLARQQPRRRAARRLARARRGAPGRVVSGPTSKSTRPPPSTSASITPSPRTMATCAPRASSQPRQPAPRRLRLTGAQGLQIHQLGLESGFKYCGVSLYGEYASASSMCGTPGSRVHAAVPADRRDVNGAQHGGYVQAGYFSRFPAGEEAGSRRPRRRHCVNRKVGDDGRLCRGRQLLPRSNRVKLQADVTKCEQVPLSAVSCWAMPNDDALIFRVQLQVAF